MGHFGPKNSGSAGRIFLTFCAMKGANRQMRMMSIIFQKKFVWGKWTFLGPKMAHPHNSGSAVRIFLNFEKGQQVDESNNNVLYQKNFVQHKWAILDPKMTHPHNSGTF